ncbi:Response regulator receiver domain-containing protein [Arboricoccus pini]|uniref:Response regulator receiver domain-containing protein n=1 Tax=Arboricoccus pini TaxID=1963835 RepID=A0A212R3Y8_9PROT|nr:response regulator [Arboricoccus pini]SNB66724.1 Response regulator receiver domain-containing protein [Arboricoccus pini]
MTETSHSSPPQEDGLGERVVLLLEDDDVHAAIIEHLLDSMGLLTLHVRDLAAARALLRERWVDMIVADLLLPDSMPMNSLSALLDLAERIPIVVVTAWMVPLHGLHGGTRLKLFDKCQFDPGAFKVLVRYLLSSAAPEERLNPFVDPL